MKLRFTALQTTSVMAVVGCLTIGCSADIHDNTITIPNWTINATTSVDVDNVMPDQSVPIAVTVSQAVFLVPPDVMPPPEHVADAGHIQIYLDDVAKPPLVITAEVNVMVTIPAQTPPGKHKLICRVHKHDGTPTSTKQEIAITVKATVTIAPDGGTSVDANVSVDANAALDVTVSTDTGT
jgi:hypothetical protein